MSLLCRTWGHRFEPRAILMHGTGHWTLKVAAALGIVAGLGYWKHKGLEVPYIRRREPWLRERVNDACDEVEALSSMDTATGSIPNG